MPVILGANSASGGYNITNSLRFNSGSSDRLNRTLGTATNSKLFTFSTWFKLSKLSTERDIIRNYVDGDNRGYFHLETGDTLFIFIKGGATDQLQWRSTQLFRDVSAWYHLVVKADSTQASQDDRFRVYLNGSEITAWTKTTQPSQNIDWGFNKNSATSYIGSTQTPSEYFDGYMADTFFIDGQALTPSSFGETDTDTGIWKPKAYTGTYGTNGFYLKFANSASLGTDSSGNGNTFTVNNLTSIDQTTDTPTNNFNTLNPLVKLGSNFSAPTEGNLSLSSSGTGDSGFFASTIIPSAGKWYFEAKVTAVSSSDRTKISIANFESVTGSNNLEGGDYKGISVCTGTTGRIAVTNGATTTEFDVAGYVPVANDIMIFAVDMDNSRVYIGKNGTWFTTTASSGGDPATSTGYFSPVLGNGFAVGAGHGSGVSVSATHQFNFGNPIYSANSYTDGAGYGNFSYAVPSGYYSLNTRNLANFG